tara:strand:- start:4517 stop:5218 length:702 start_codon:yes stop_codon:yes gene_type:complete
MLKDYIQTSQKRINEQVTNFYTSTGIHVYFKDQLYDNKVDVEKAVSRLESLIPTQLLNEVEMIIIGHFDEFDERNINAFFKDGTIHVSNIQESEDDLLDDLIHETAHANETAYGYEIYGDSKIKDEFLTKRGHLYTLLWNAGFKAPKRLFLQTEYDHEFDHFLYQDVGYAKLSQIVNGMFISPYSPTSLREYFATGFTEFYLHPNDHSYLKRISPALYGKLEKINNIETLDNQ